MEVTRHRGTFPFTATETQTHVFTMAGTYTLKLTVRDDGGVAGVLIVIIL